MKVQKITITPGQYSLAVGKKLTLKATVGPKKATNKKVVWSSSNTKYAAVNNKGVVTAKKGGAGKTERSRRKRRMEVVFALKSRSGS